MGEHHHIPCLASCSFATPLTLMDSLLQPTSTAWSHSFSISGLAYFHPWLAETIIYRPRLPPRSKPEQACGEATMQYTRSTLTLMRTRLCLLRVPCCTEKSSISRNGSPCLCPASSLRTLSCLWSLCTSTIVLRTPSLVSPTSWADSPSSPSRRTLFLALHHQREPRSSDFPPFFISIRLWNLRKLSVGFEFHNNEPQEDDGTPASCFTLNWLLRD